MFLDPFIGFPRHQQTGSFIPKQRKSRFRKQALVSGNEERSRKFEIYVLATGELQLGGKDYQRTHVPSNHSNNRHTKPNLGSLYARTQPAIPPRYFRRTCSTAENKCLPLEAVITEQSRTEKQKARFSRCPNDVLTHRNELHDAVQEE